MTRSMLTFNKNNEEIIETADISSQDEKQ